MHVQKKSSSYTVICWLYPISCTHAHTDRRTLALGQPLGQGEIVKISTCTYGAAGRARQLSTPYQIGDEQYNDTMMQVETPVKLPIWEAACMHALAQHPDQWFAQYILNGLWHCFRIGFQHGRAPLQQAGYNLQCPEPTIVSEYLSYELKLNSRQAQTCSPFGLISKKNKPGKW